MFRALVLALASLDDDEPAVWEVYDEDFAFAPGGAAGDHANAVVDNLDGTLTMRIDVYAGAGIRYDDGVFAMEVLCHATGRTEMALVDWDAGNSRAIVTTTTYLGQSSPATDRTAYSVRPLWVTPQNIVDGTEVTSGNPFGQDGTLTFDLPFAEDTNLSTGRRWAITEVNGVQAFWLRCRKTNGGAGGSTDLTSLQADTIDKAPWWVQIPVTQGELVDDALDDGTGDAFQRFTINAPDPVEGSWSFFVNNEEWSVISTLYGAQPSDTVVMVDETPDGQLEFVAGDGVTGKIVPDGATVAAEYRVGAAINGNVGAGRITQPQSSFPKLDDFDNPFAADGWKDRDAADATGRERMRWWLPAQARVARDVVVTVEDAENHAVDKFKVGSRSPIGRADGFESALDSQVITIFVLSPGGAQLSTDDLAAAGEYFNGRLIGLQRRGKRTVSNQQVQPVNATLRTINATVDIEVRKGRSGGVQAAVGAAVKAYLHPMSTGDDGRLQHRVAGKVSRALASNAAAAVVDRDSFVDINLEFTGEGDPTASVQLNAGELPIFGAVVVNVTEVE